ncbi:accessory Sec system protein Asp1 [Streptococcus uberis]|uniref:accessory Sec system protein Asp1 n=1 Tax=Streptococcus uberis TaxID=1349 RepID=UPI0012B66A9E|nr:accessory Sec system protein Asp1 [Streptococcus uberis]MTB57708.1 accessory Sec system protein Asp1 [Streptococcus uberis]
MFYFVPAWYNSHRPWSYETPLWFRVYERMVFDDTINQYRMFENAGEEGRLLILNYHPQLRYFLHKQSLAGTSYWSFFDDVQNIQQHETKAIDFKVLNWPEDISFFHSPFAVIAKSQGRVYAHIQFAENGNLLQIEILGDGYTERIYYFDDRGFLSSLLFLDESGQKVRQDYLNTNGVWQIREYFDGEEVVIEVNPQSDTHFQKNTYTSWESLIAERLSTYRKRLMSEEDHVIIAADEQHNQLLLGAFPEQGKIFSFFGSRYDYKNQNDLDKLIQNAKLIVLDTEKQEHQFWATASLCSLPLTQIKSLRVSTFDTRLRLGHSQMVKELNIHFFIDTISDQEIAQLLPPLLDQLSQNPLFHLDFVSFDSSRDLTGLQDRVEEHISKHYQREDFYMTTEDSGENQLEEGEMELKNISFSHLTNEIQLIQKLDTARLVIDLGQVPDLYTQIASISAGVPQINVVESEYVEHQKNGWILRDTQELSLAMSYYFDGLANWNASLVYAVEKMSEYTSGRLLERWKLLLAVD